MDDSKYQCTNTNVIPLVMHRVVSDKPIDFEDIDISTLDFIAKLVGENWVTL